jgi:hypothetical protein
MRPRSHSASRGALLCAIGLASAMLVAVLAAVPAFADGGRGGGANTGVPGGC